MDESPRELSEAVTRPRQRTKSWIILACALLVGVWAWWLLWNPPPAPPPRGEPSTEEASAGSAASSSPGARDLEPDAEGGGSEGIPPDVTKRSLGTSGAPTAGSVSLPDGKDSVPSRPPTTRTSRGRPPVVLTSAERRARERKLKEIEKRWRSEEERLREDIRSRADRHAWGWRSFNRALGMGLRSLQERRAAVPPETLYGMNSRAIDDVVGQAHMFALERALDGGWSEQASRVSPQWVSWVTGGRAPGPPAPLEPDDRAILAIDLSPVRYSDWTAEPGLFEADIDPVLADALEEERKQHSTLTLDVRPLVLGSSIALETQETMTVKVDLDRLFPSPDTRDQLRLRVGDSPTLADLSEVFAAAKIRLDLTAKEPGCSAVALSISRHFRVQPLDHLVRTVEVVAPGGTPRGCSVDSRPASFAAGLRTLLLHRGAPEVDAALHIFDAKFDSKPTTAIYWLTATSPDVVAWENSTLEQELSNKLSFQQEIEKARNHTTRVDADGVLAAPDYSKVASRLERAIFSARTADGDVMARRARGELVELSRRPGKDRPVLLVRKSDENRMPEMFPAELLSAPGASAFLDKPVRVVQPLPREDYRPQGRCIASLAIAISPEVKVDRQVPLHELERSPSWLHANDDSPAVLRSFLDGTHPPPSQSGEALILLAHHDNGRLWYEEDGEGAREPVYPGDLNRRFKPGSLALLASCSAGSWDPKEAWLAYRLNELGVETLIVSPFELDATYGKAFAVEFAYAAARHLGHEPKSVLELFDEASEQAALSMEEASGGYDFSQSSLELFVAGNYDLRLCGPEEMP